MTDVNWLDLESVVPLGRAKPPKPGSKPRKIKPRRSAEEITSLSPDTLKRRFPQFVLTLSARRRGMKVRHALEIAAGKHAAAWT